MFNFNFYFLIYLLKNSSPLNFNLLSFEKRYILTQLQMHPEFSFLYNKKFKSLYFLYQLQQLFLFLSFVVLGFFSFSSISSILHFDNFSLGFFKIWEDFVNLHYISLFIVSLSLFSLLSLFNAFIQFKINQKILLLKNITFPLKENLELFESDLFMIEKLPLFNIIQSNDNLYGVILLLAFEKHIELQEIKLIPDYFKKHI